MSEAALGCGVSHALGVVAGARGDDSAGVTGVGHLDDLVVRTAGFERPGLLEVFEFQHHVGADAFTQRGRSLGGRLANTVGVVDTAGCPVNVLE